MADINPIFRPLISPARYKIAKNGRGSGKSWSVARLLIEIAGRGNYRFQCGRELQNSIGDFVIKLPEDTIERHGLPDAQDADWKAPAIRVCTH